MDPGPKKQWHIHSLRYLYPCHCLYTRTTPRCMLSEPPVQVSWTTRHSLQQVITPLVDPYIFVLPPAQLRAILLIEPWYQQNFAKSEHRQRQRTVHRSCRQYSSSYISPYWHCQPPQIPSLRIRLLKSRLLVFQIVASFGINHSDIGRGGSRIVQAGCLLPAP